MDIIKQLLDENEPLSLDNYQRLLAPETKQFVSSHLDTEYKKEDDSAVDAKVDALLSGSNDELRATLLAAERIKSTLKDIRSHETRATQRSRWYSYLAGLDVIVCDACDGSDDHTHSDESRDDTEPERDKPAPKQECEECATLREQSPTRLQVVNAIERFPTFLMTHVLDPATSDPGQFVMICSFVIDGKWIGVEYLISVMHDLPTEIAIAIDGKVVNTYDRTSLHGRMIDFYSNPINFMCHFHLVRDGYFDEVHIASELAEKIKSGVLKATDEANEPAESSAVNPVTSSDDGLNNETQEPTESSVANPGTSSSDVVADETPEPTEIPPKPVRMYNTEREVFQALYPHLDVAIYDRMEDTWFKKDDPNADTYGNAISHTNKVWNRSLAAYDRMVADWRDEIEHTSRNSSGQN